MPSPKAVGLEIEESDRRSAEAVARIVAALGIAGPEEVREKSGQVQRMKEAGALADFLERVAGAVEERLSPPAARTIAPPPPDEEPEEAETEDAPPPDEETEEPPKPARRSRSRKATANK